MEMDSDDESADEWLDDLGEAVRTECRCKSFHVDLLVIPTIFWLCVSFDHSILCFRVSTSLST